MNAPDRIPTVDFEPFRAGGSGDRARAAAELGDIFQRYGFVSLVGHGLPRAVIDGAFAAAGSFFDQPLAAKMTVRDNQNNRGFIPLLDTAVPGQKPSGLEAFSLGHLDRPADRDLLSLPFFSPTPWPDLPHFRERVEACYRALYGLGEALLRAVALHLGQSEDFFAALSRDTYSNMRLIHYPPQEAVAATSDFGVSAHVDRGLLTVLVQDDNGGLSVLAPDGVWLPVVPDPEAVVVNVGALLRRWTNGRYAAALHRVINVSGRERYSMPLFMHPSFHTRIDPRTLVDETPATPDFEAIVAGEEVFAGFRKERPSWTRPADTAV